MWGVVVEARRIGEGGVQVAGWEAGFLRWQEPKEIEKNVAMFHTFY